jgi:DNA-binding Lrp family transcriptional regulator
MRAGLSLLLGVRSICSRMARFYRKTRERCCRTYALRPAKLSAENHGKAVSAAALDGSLGKCQIVQSGGKMKDNDTSFRLDHLDLKILAKLQTDARITNQELADAVGLSPSPCLQRVKRLERAGIISLYQAQIDLNKVCRHVDVIAAVTLNSHGLEDFNDFEKMVAGMRHVVECTKLSGTIDYLVRFICPDIGSYQMLSDELLKLGPKVGNLSSYIVLKAVKPFRGVVLDDLVAPH